jgi:hypothetical protein
MPKPIEFTAAQDAEIRILRESGMSFVNIGLKLELAYSTVERRVARLGILKPPCPPSKLQLKRERRMGLRPKNNRAALPSGHPETWGAISNDPYPGISA